MAERGPDLRVLVHALDRTGPPKLAQAVLEVHRRLRPHDRAEVLAFRGGPLEQDLASLAPVSVVLRPHEPWSVAAPPPDRERELVERFAGLPTAGVNLLVSVAAGQVLPLLPDELGPVVTWVVEVGDDLHWLEEPTGLLERTHRWWAGSRASAAELAAWSALAASAVELVPEMIEDPEVPSLDAVRAARRELGAPESSLLVVGAGIGTRRKGLDLFVEAAAALGRRLPGAVRCHWVGGADDALWPRVAGDLERAELGHLTIEPARADLASTFAAADVVLHPARADAFPLVCVHAAALGAPVVGFSGVGGLTEMLADGFRGGPYPDLERLVDAVLELVDPARRSETAAQQRRSVAAHLASAAGPVVLHHLDRARRGAAA